MTRHTLIALVALVSITLTSAPALASDNVAFRMASGLGRVIAAQGNAAFQHLRDDVRRDVAQKFRDWLSAPGATAQEGSVANSGLEDLVRMHEELRQSSGGDTN